jgi:glycosyltransferase involved in cell wall biosynthesis
VDISFLVPGSLETRTGGYEYDRRIIAGLRTHGWRVAVHELDAGFPNPTRPTLMHATDVFRAIPDGSLVVVDGLAFGAMPDEVTHEARRLRFVPVIHQPLGEGVGLTEEAAADLRASERRALASAALVIVTGAGTMTAMAQHGVAPDRVALVEPGTDKGRVSMGSRSDTLELLTVATVNSGKGHALLVEALAGIDRRDWHLTCAGSLDRDPAAVARVRDLLRDHHLEDRVSLVGELGGDDLEACYARADLFVLPTLSETYGMAVAEALAHGLPVISTNVGAIPQLVGDGAGMIIAAGDVHALRGALRLVMTDKGVRARFAFGARRVRQRLRSWDAAVETMAAALERIPIDG